MLHVISGHALAGAEKQVLNTVVGLAKHTLINPKVLLFHEGVLSRKLRDAGIEVFVVPLRLLTTPIALSTIRRIISENQIDVVHCHGYKANTMVSAALMGKRGILRFQTCHGLPEPFSGFKQFKYRLYNVLDRWIMRHRVDRVIAVSRDVHEFLSSFLPQGKISSLPNSVDIVDGDGQSSIPELKSSLGFDPTDKIVGIIGRLVPVKNHFTFVDLIAELDSRDSAVRGLVVGDGPLRTELEKYAIQKEISSKIFFSGFREDVDELLKVIDIVVLTSLHEGLPMVLLEALGQGVPVVASDVGGVAEVLSQFCSECLIPPADTKGFADRCMSILHNPDRRVHLAAAGKRIVAERYSLKVCSALLADIYQEEYRKKQGVV